MRRHRSFRAGERWKRLLPPVLRTTRRDDELLEALWECQYELGIWVFEHYKTTLHHPSEERRYNRDMQPVFNARALLVKHGISETVAWRDK